MLSPEMVADLTHITAERLADPDLFQLQVGGYMESNKVFERTAKINRFRRPFGAPAITLFLLTQTDGPVVVLPWVAPKESLAEIKKSPRASWHQYATLSLEDEIGEHARSSLRQGRDLVDMQSSMVYRSGRDRARYLVNYYHQRAVDNSAVKILGDTARAIPHVDFLVYENGSLKAKRVKPTPLRNQ